MSAGAVTLDFSKAQPIAPPQQQNQTSGKGLTLDFSKAQPIAPSPTKTPIPVQPTQPTQQQSRFPQGSAWEIATRPQGQPVVGPMLGKLAETVVPKILGVDTAKQDAQYIDAITQTIAAKHGVRPDVLAHQIQVESGGDQNKTGKAGELGLMQVMPQTWVNLAAQNPDLGDFNQNARDPEKNIEAGAMYLRQLLDAHNQNYHDALSFYNAAKNRQAGDQYADKVLAGIGRATIREDQQKTVASRISPALTHMLRPSTSPEAQAEQEQTEPQVALPEGMREQGNINLIGRPIVRNDDGSISTEFSTSFGTSKGEVLVPTVVNGRFLTPDGKKPPEGYRDKNGKYHPTPEERTMWNRAREHYEQTGENMGIFDTPEHADAYAVKVHNRQLQSSGPALFVYRGDEKPSSSLVESPISPPGLGTAEKPQTPRELGGQPSGRWAGFQPSLDELKDPKKLVAALRLALGGAAGAGEAAGMEEVPPSAPRIKGPATRPKPDPEQFTGGFGPEPAERPTPRMRPKEAKPAEATRALDKPKAFAPRRGATGEGGGVVPGSDEDLEDLLKQSLEMVKQRKTAETEE